MTLSSDRPSGPVAAPQQVQCLCGHDAGSHNALKFNCMATTGGTHATRCGCKAFTDADRPSGQTPTDEEPEIPAEWVMDAEVATAIGMEVVWRQPIRAYIAKAWMRHPEPELRRGGQYARVPSWSTNMEDAWHLVGLMGMRGFHAVVKSPFEPGAECWAGFTPHGTTGWNGRPDFYESAETAPLAICLAALKALENHV